MSKHVFWPSTWELTKVTLSSLTIDALLMLPQVLKVSNNKVSSYNNEMFVSLTVDPWMQFKIYESGMTIEVIDSENCGTIQSNEIGIKPYASKKILPFFNFLGYFTTL